MNIENLKEGQVIKSYRELCVVVGISVTTGNSKKAQLKELDRYCRYHKEGNKFIIDEIYEEPLPKEDNRSGNNNINYIKYIETLLLNLLATDETGLLFLSKYTILKELKMISNNYSFCKGRIEKLSLFENIDSNNIYEFYASADTTLIGNLEKALNNLEDKSLIKWSKEKSVCECIENSLNQIEDCVQIDEYDEEYHIYKNRLDLNYRQATTNEVQKIIYYEKLVMDELGRENKQEIVKHKEWKVFKKKVQEYLINYGITFYYDSYKIIFNFEHICEELIEICNYLLTEKEKKNNENYLNNEIINRLKENIKKKQYRAKEKTNSILGKIKDDNLIRRLKDTYLQDQYKLIDILVDKEAKNIKSKVKRQKLSK